MKILFIKKARKSTFTITHHISLTQSNNSIKSHLTITHLPLPQKVLTIYFVSFSNNVLWCLNVMTLASTLGGFCLRFSLTLFQSSLIHSLLSKFSSLIQFKSLLFFQLTKYSLLSESPL